MAGQVLQTQTGPEGRGTFWKEPSQTVAEIKSVMPSICKLSGKNDVHACVDGNDDGAIALVDSLYYGQSSGIRASKAKNAPLSKRSHDNSLPVELPSRLLDNFLRSRRGYLFPKSEKISRCSVKGH